MALTNIMLATMLVALSSAYPNGPPTSDAVCTAMYPTGHKDKKNVTVSGPQDWVAPYELLTSTTGACFKAGQVVEMMLKVTNASYYFEGYFAQVQKGDNKTNFGTFEAFANDTYSKKLDCFSKPGSAIGQANKAHFISRKFKWTAPATGLTADAYLRATIVKNQRTFWTDLKFDLKYDASCAAGTALKAAEIQPDDSHEVTDAPDVNDNAGRMVPVILVSMVTIFFAIALP